MSDSEHVVTKGTVTAAFQGLAIYSVATDTHGTVECYAVGVSRGRLGVQETATYTIGCRVTCLIIPVIGNVNTGIIIGAAADRVSPVTELPPVLSQYPQSVGVEFAKTFQDGEPSNPEARRLVSEWYALNQRLAAYGVGLSDAVDGEWAMTSFLGSGVGAENFRAWIRGGPMSSVECFADNQLTRMVGATLEIISMGQYYVDRVNGPVNEIFNSRCYYTSDSTSNVYADAADVGGQFFEVDSPLFLGHQKTLAPRVKDNVGPSGQSKRQTTAPALIHEYRGIDGSYVLTTAASLTLQKFVGTRTLRRPIVTGSTEAVTAAGLPGAVGSGTPSGTILTDVPLQTPEQVEPTADLNRLALLSVAGFVLNQVLTVTSKPPLFPPQDSPFAAKIPPLASVLMQAGLRLSTINHQASNPALANSYAATLGYVPRTWLSPTGDDAMPLFDGLIERDPSMWKRAPTSFTLNVGPYGQSKRFFFGHAFITITDEGDIILQNASGTQLMLAGGNIYASAEHDIIRVAGRNLVDMAGQDAAVRVARHMDVVTHEGRLTMQAAGQLTAIGGAAGAAGVTIESRGRSGVGTVNDGANAQDNTGLRLVANHATVVVAGLALVGHFTKPCFITMPRFGFYNGQDTYTTIGNGLWTANRTKTSFITPSSAYFHVVHVIDILAAKTFKQTSVTTNAEKLLAGTTSDICTLEDDLQAADLAVSGITDSGSFQSSSDYNIVSMEAFAIPLPAWYMARLRENSLKTFNATARWTAIPDTAGNSQALPGFSYMSSYGAGSSTELAATDPGHYLHPSKVVTVERLAFNLFGKGL